MSSSASQTIAKSTNGPEASARGESLPDGTTHGRSTTAQSLPYKSFAPEKHTLLLSLLLVASILVCYLPAAHNVFLNYDDYAYITSNPHVRAGLTWATVKW